MINNNQKFLLVVKRVLKKYQKLNVNLIFIINLMKLIKNYFNQKILYNNSNKKIIVNMKKQMMMSRINQKKWSNLYKNW